MFFLHYITLVNHVVYNYKIATPLKPESTCILKCKLLKSSFQNEVMK